MNRLGTRAELLRGRLTTAHVGWGAGGPAAVIGRLTAALTGDTVALLRDKSAVLPVGIDLRRLDPEPQTAAGAAASPLVVWNQRLEYDKNPERFIDVLLALAAEGLPFRVALCGERFGKPTEAWERGVAELGERVIHDGYADDDLYRRLLWAADVTISTAGSGPKLPRVPPAPGAPASNDWASSSRFSWPARAPITKPSPYRVTSAPARTGSSRIRRAMD